MDYHVEWPRVGGKNALRHGVCCIVAVGGLMYNGKLARSGLDRPHLSALGPPNSPPGLNKNLVEGPWYIYIYIFIYIYI